MKIAARKKKPAERKHDMSVPEFEALAPSEKERIVAEIEGKSTEQLMAESRPLTPAERAEWSRYMKGNRKRRGSAGRPKLGPRGRGVKVISLSVEKDLLDKADAAAKSRGMKRAEFFSRAILAAVG